jgi:hypothetical protein
MCVVGAGPTVRMLHAAGLLTGRLVLGRRGVGQGVLYGSDSRKYRGRIAAPTPPQGLTSRTTREVETRLDYALRTACIRPAALRSRPERTKPPSIRSAAATRPAGRPDHCFGRTRLRFPGFRGSSRIVERIVRNDDEILPVGGRGRRMSRAGLPAPGGMAYVGTVSASPASYLERDGARFVGRDAGHRPRHGRRRGAPRERKISRPSPLDGVGWWPAPLLRP